MGSRAYLGVLAAVLVSATGLIVAPFGLGEAQTLPQRFSFGIATGPSGGTYFPVGQTIAGLISNPPGDERCQNPDMCGPRGLIATVRTSDGAVANVLSVNESDVDSGLAQADVVSEAMKGTGAFKRTGKQSHIRILASLFPEDLHLVVAQRSRIHNVAGLRGKHISIGPDGSGTNVTARAVLGAFGFGERNVKIELLSADIAASMLQQGKLDAFFFVGGAPVPLVLDLCARGKATLVPIDGKGRDRLMHAVPSLETDTLPADTYPGVAATQTVRVRAVWIVRDTASPQLAYGILKALYSVSNRSQLDGAMAATRAIRIDDATDSLPAPLHSGAAKFYRDVGKLPRVRKT